MGERNDNASIDTGFDALSYSYARAPSASYIAAYAERSLWCAVIEQAFIDMCPHYFSSKECLPIEQKASRIKKQKEAQQWLLEDENAFPYICNLAGVSPSLMRRAAKHFMSIHGHSLDTSSWTASSGA